MNPNRVFQGKKHLSQAEAKSMVDRDWSDPGSLDHAKRIKERIVREFQEVQGKLTSLERTPGNRTERTRLQSIQAYSGAYLTRLNEYIRGCQIAATEAILDSESATVEMAVQLKNTAFQVCSLIQLQSTKLREMEHRVKSLEAEVSALRQRLREYETSTASAPGVGIDHWREQV